MWITTKDCSIDPIGNQETSNFPQFQKDIKSIPDQTAPETVNPDPLRHLYVSHLPSIFKKEYVTQNEKPECELCQYKFKKIGYKE